MIKRLTLKNFGPYESADINLGDFNVILGANGTGKSLLFIALRAIGRVAKYPLRYSNPTRHIGGFPTRTGQVSFDEIVHKRDTARTITIRVEIASPKLSGSYEVCLRHWQNPGGILAAEYLDVKSPLGDVSVAAHDDGKVDSNLTVPRAKLSAPRFMSTPVLLYGSKDPKEVALGELIQQALTDRIGVYRFDPTALKTPAEVGKRWSATGYNFATFLDEIRNQPGGSKAFEALVGRFHKVCPHVSDILLPVDERPIEDSTPRKRIALTMTASSQTIPADLESDGTILMLAYVSLRHGSAVHDTICVEEPENGVHPSAIPSVVDMLRDMAKPEEGNPGAQILVCTHSRPFLDAVKPWAEAIRLVRRGADGRSTVETPSDQQIPALASWAGLA